MPDLFSVSRKHDLPPKWDGRPVKWEKWDDQQGMFICPPPKPQPCVSCGSTTRAKGSTGVVHPFPGETWDRLADVVKTLPSGRQYVKGTKTVSSLARPVVRLYAFRCPDCGWDTVWDSETDQWWDLDPTDYEDDGSTDPCLPL